MSVASFDFKSRWARAATLMERDGIDALFLMKPANLAISPVTAGRAPSGFSPAPVAAWWRCRPRICGAFA